MLSKKKMKEVCKIGQGRDCCRYVGAGGNGIECLKHTGFARGIDIRVLFFDFIAQGDNCEGECDAE